MNRRILAWVVVLSLIAPQAYAAEKKSHKSAGYFSSVGLGKGLTFHAPFTDPANPLTLYKGSGSLSFTRVHDATHTATYVHPGTGLVTVADNNALRIEANGALIEGASTNYVLRSQEFDLGTWTKSNPGGTVPSVSADNTTSPDGTASAERIAFSTQGAGTYNILYQAASFSNVATTVSVYVSTPSGTATLWPATTPDGVTYISAVCNATTSWSRCAASGTATAATWYSGFGVDLRDGTQSSQPAFTVYAWQYQVERLPFATSVIPTTATTIDRNADVLTFLSSGNFDNTAGTLAVSWTPLYANTIAASGNYYIFDAGALEAYWNSTDDKIYLTDGTNTISTAALTFAANTTMKLAFSWGAEGLAIYKDGATGATGATYTAAVPNANIYLGSNTSGANQAYAQYVNAYIWNLQFTAAEGQAVTQ